MESPPLARVEKILILVITGLLAVFLVAKYFTLGLPPPSEWDFLLISGWLTFVWGRIAVQSVPSRFASVINRLTGRGVLDPSQREVLVSAMELSARLWGYRGAVVAGCGILVARAMTSEKLPTFDGGFLAFVEFFPVVAEFLGGLIAGYYLGQMVGYGLFWNLLRKRGASITPVVGYIDGAAGLKPVGDFYFYQATVASLPAIFTAVWLLLFPLFARYQHWRDPYLLLLAIGIIFGVGAFILPMLGFHRLMLRERDSSLDEADKIGKELSRLDETLANEKNLSSNEAKTLSERRELLTKKYEALEDMPTWPFDRSIKKRFAVRNVFLVTPLLFEIAGIQPAGALKSFLEVVQKWPGT